MEEEVIIVTAVGTKRTILQPFSIIFVIGLPINKLPRHNLPTIRLQANVAPSILIYLPIATFTKTSGRTLSIKFAGVSSPKTTVRSRRKQELLKFQGDPPFRLFCTGRVGPLRRLSTSIGINSITKASPKDRASWQIAHIPM